MMFFETALTENRPARERVGHRPAPPLIRGTRSREATAFLRAMSPAHSVAA